MSGPGGADGRPDPVAALLAANSANRGEAGQTIILVTHDQAVADAASRIVTMRDGRIVTSAVTAAGAAPAQAR